MAVRAVSELMVTVALSVVLLRRARSLLQAQRVAAIAVCAAVVYPFAAEFAMRQFAGGSEPLEILMLTSLQLTLPNGEVAMARGRGLTYSILAKATMPNGIWDQIEATVRLGGGSDGRPYRVLRWKEGFHH